MSRIVALTAAAVIVGALPATASATDYAATARTIMPSGELGGLPVAADADVQAKMYDALTPLFSNVTDADLQKDFTSDGFGVGPDGPATAEPVPRAGVTITRDRFHIPHIVGATRDDVTWAMGWVTEEDRGLLLAEARYPGRLAALDAPNIDAFGLVKGLKQFTPTKQADKLIASQQTASLKAMGKQGADVLHDIGVYLQGLNARLKAEHSTSKPFTIVDVAAANALVGQIFGQGGGDEARRSEMLSALTKHLGAKQGDAAFDALSEADNPQSPSSMTKTFSYGRPGSSRKGNAILDNGSLKLAGKASLAARTATTHQWASNFQLISAAKSGNGHPLFVGGPQIGYYYPGLTFEADVQGPGFQARGASVPGFPGTFVIGRGPDYAWTLTSAGSDLIDTYAETLCGGSRTRYLFKGKCRRMGTVDAGVIKGQGRVKYHTTVHGPVTGYAKVHGKTVALSRKRASYGQDLVWQSMFRDLTGNVVHDPASFFKSAAKSPFTFNIGYADDRHIAMFSAGKLPIRPKGVDPRLPTKGTGQYEWKGFLAARRHPQQVDPPSGMLVNWNNRPAPGFAAADDNWSWGATQRVVMLDRNLQAKGSPLDLPKVVGAMNAAATQDLRSVVLTPLLQSALAGTAAPSPRDQQMLGLLDGWSAAGSSRLDVDLNGKIDAGAAPAIWDALAPRLLKALVEPSIGAAGFKQLLPLIGEDSGSGSDFSDGGTWYVDEALKTKSPAKAKAIWAAFDAAGAALQAQQGTADASAWTADANNERIGFAPGLLTTTIRFTNRPSGIQQVLTFTGHRP